MKVKLVVIIAMMWTPFSAHAQCPVQETMVMYLNGADVKVLDAWKSKERIKEGLLDEPGVTEDCVFFDYTYNTNELIVLDWIESYFQAGGEAVEYWRNFLRFDAENRPIEALFNSSIDFLADLIQTEVSAAKWVLGNQKAEHLARYEMELNPDGLNRQLILVPHSQGNFYANEEWDDLTPSQQANTHIVATATPSSLVADGGPYVSVDDDLLVQTAFAAVGALPANISNNTERCAGSLASVNRWTCHGFKEEYMATGKPSRQQIVNDIAALLPVAVSLGTVEGFTVQSICGPNPGAIVPNAIVQLLDVGGDFNVIVAETTSDTSGFFRVSAPPGGYFFEDASGTPLIIAEGETLMRNFVVLFACD